MTEKKTFSQKQENNIKYRKQFTEYNMKLKMLVTSCSRRLTIVTETKSVLLLARRSTCGHIKTRSRFNVRSGSAIFALQLLEGAHADAPASARSIKLTPL